MYSLSSNDLDCFNVERSTRLRAAIAVYPWLMLMYCMRVEKKLKCVKKYEPIAWLKPGLCMMGVFCVTKMKHSQNYMIRVGSLH